MTAAPRPVLKWAGGKSRLLHEILGRLPEKMKTYYEPFVGGAAVYFSLALTGRFRRAVLSDRNDQLIDVYQGLRDDVDGVIAMLRQYRHHHDEYYRIRALDPGSLDRAERAARLIYLNKTGYNGLFRVNRAGKFNVPFGRYKKVNFCDEENLRAAARALKNAHLDVVDFEVACSEAKKEDAVYFDPPYVPLSRTASFTAYHSEPFDEEEHRRLARLFAALADRGVPAVLSNSDTTLTRKLYKDWNVRKISVTRPINSKGERRGAVGELLVINRPRRR